MAGRVVLVGAGPGDVGLITRAGQRWIERADVIVYDYLVNPTLLSWARPDAELILAGKHGGGPRVDQEEILRILLHHAQAGKTVVRLKGGDPFLFGRGGEEAEAAVRKMADHFRDRRPEIIVGVESRGFLIGAPLAYDLGLGFVVIRKPGKLPAEKAQTKSSVS